LKTSLRALRGCPLCALLFFFSCGIEDYVYLEPVQYVNSSGVSTARMPIPGNSGNSAFRYYNIYYRIYLSDYSLESISTDVQRNQINPALASHYNTIDPYTSDDNVSPNAIASIFSSLNYHTLYYLGSNRIDEYSAYQVFTNSGFSPGFQSLNDNDILTFDFTSPADGPYITISYASPPGTAQVFLYRSSDRFTPRPSRLFLNSTGSGNLTDEAIISENVNADVERNSNMVTSFRYAFVSLYAVAVGIDANFTALYSKPKHIGIFRLP
jgi:hypothetical protein